MIRIITAYPNLLNLYGDYINAAALARYLTESGCEAMTVPFTVGNYVNLLSADMIYIGAGTERRMLAALDDFRRFFDELFQYVDGGGLVLATGSAACLLGRNVTDIAGHCHEAAGILDIEAFDIGKRRYSELLMRCGLDESPVIGNVNSSLSVKWRDPAFFEIRKQSGNLTFKTEGAVKHNVFATEVSGPLLLRNPRLLHTFAERLADRTLPENDNDWVRKAYAGYHAALETLSNEL